MTPMSSDSNTIRAFGRGFLDRGPVYLMCALILYGPFHYALTTRPGEILFTQVASVAIFIFLWDAFVKERWPQVPALPLACMTVILLLGLWMTFNASSYYRWHTELFTMRVLTGAPFPDLPGSYARFASTQLVTKLTVIFGLVVIFLNQNETRRERILFTFMVSVLGCALLGTAMKFFEPIRDLYWDANKYKDRGMVEIVFAAFRYHAHSASFLVTGLCVSGGFWLHSVERRQPKGKRFLCALSFFCIFCALFLNTSRAGWVLSLVAMIGLTTMALLRRTRRFSRKEILAGLVGLVLLGAIAASVFLAEKEYRTERVQTIRKHIQSRAPIALFIKIIPETPVLGFGPGSLPNVFPKYQRLHPDLFAQDKFLNAAHQDYFQFFFEWGAGLIVWVALLLTPVGLLFAQIRRLGWRRAANPLTASCTLAISITLMHSMGDFPLQMLLLQLAFFICWSTAVSAASPDDGTANERSSAI
ncbi:MAG: hypothetical protein CMO80_07690 [Verrucomicrobiales bacterium]|nr:hypothetical protein [Verrucomicrobiales bacterium]